MIWLRRSAGLALWMAVGLAGASVLFLVDMGSGPEVGFSLSDRPQLTQLTAVVLLVAWSGVSLAWIRPHINRFHLQLRRPGIRSLVGLGTVSAAAVVPSPVSEQRVVPVDAIAPAVAWSVLRRILDRRGEQARSNPGDSVPRRFSPSEMETLSMLARVARAPHAVTTAEPPDLPPAAAALLSAASETEPSPPKVCGDDWQLVVRLMGEPCVENRAGVRANFSKRRSLELLCWMVLNRDRSTRSAARTAMWDMDVADSTFSTIVSDLRRALASVSVGALDASPRTYGDSLPLGAGIVSDVELLDGSVAAFLRDGSGLDDVVSGLAMVRDLPFAGTAYQWVDLDGSTTRVILSVMRAVNLVIEEGQRTGRHDLLLAATRAGLRVMPGDERLLAHLTDSTHTWGS